MKTTIVNNQTGSWYIVDADGQTIGKVASNVAHVLRGKHRVAFSPHQLCPDQVIVINIEKLSITPKKAMNKTYFHHRGMLGHWTETTLEKMMERHPERVLEIAIKGMLPANRLRPRMLKHLHLIEGTEHKYSAQKPAPLALSL